ncbi:hypothetical protein TNIN_251081 [Trichonephila inaurata madagascariensis]|uniref:Elongation factor 2 n=2 Tax=Trichonephila inaurata madagascariensis TaxID=2747483 RepID=A0A8X6YHE9_9ARAC|nr:hypothetical protein TNIN_251081 [Trichonephila inaurata madagascariensis]
MIKCITEEPGEYIVAGTEEFHLEICLEDLKEANAFIPFMKTDAVGVVPESVSIEVKRSTPEKRRLLLRSQAQAEDRKFHWQL